MIRNDGEHGKDEILRAVQTMAGRRPLRDFRAGYQIHRKPDKGSFDFRLTNRIEI